MVTFKAMNQKTKTILLRSLTGNRSFLTGNEFGKKTFQQLHGVISTSPGVAVFKISLKGIKATDASFPRESVISLIKLLSGEKGILVSDFSSDDLVDNWDYAAKAKNQPAIIYKNGSGYDVIGPKLSEGTKELFDYVMKEGVVTTSKVAKKFDISAQNASAKLKKLLTIGLVLGSKETAETGGIEYVYHAIRNSDKTV